MNFFLAFSRAFRSLFHKKVFLHLLWPSLVAIAIWGAVGYFSWDWLTSGIFNWVENWPWIGKRIGGSEIASGTALLMIKMIIFIAYLPLIYVTSSIILGAFALPLILEFIAKKEYPDIEQRHGGTNAGSIWNTTTATLVFIAALVFSLPFWLIPGVGFIVPMLLVSWFNQRTYGYDALVLHADKEEIRAVQQKLRAPMMVIGICCSLLLYVPLLNLLAPAFTGLTFVHYLLGNLRKLRAGAPLGPA